MHALLRGAVFALPRRLRRLPSPGSAPRGVVVAPIQPRYRPLPSHDPMRCTGSPLATSARSPPPVATQTGRGRCRACGVCAGDTGSARALRESHRVCASRTGSRSGGATTCLACSWATGGRVHRAKPCAVCSSVTGGRCARTPVRCGPVRASRAGPGRAGQGREASFARRASTATAAAAITGTATHTAMPTRRPTCVVIHPDQRSAERGAAGEREHVEPHHPPAHRRGHPQLTSLTNTWRVGLSTTNTRPAATWPARTSPVKVNTASAVVSAELVAPVVSRTASLLDPPRGQRPLGPEVAVSASGKWTSNRHPGP